MALQSNAIESRLEGLRLDERRTMFDSKLRAFRLDSKSQAMAGHRTSKTARKLELDRPIDQVITLMEELSSRIDGLEKKYKDLGDEIRFRGRRDRRWRSMSLAVGVIAAGLLLARCIMHWL
jgi:hypothetical protein